MLSYIKHYACGETSQMRVDWMACYIAVSTALIAYTLYHTSIPASGVLHVLQVSEKRQMSILGWWPETVIFGPVFQVQPQIQMSCSQLHKRAERIGCMLMEKGRLNTGDHVALIYPPGQSQIIDLHLKQFSVKGFVICYEGKSFHLLTQWFGVSFWQPYGKQFNVEGFVPHNEILPPPSAQWKNDCKVTKSSVFLPTV